MNIDHALTIPGWMAFEELEYLASVASKSLAIAEIGSWKGRSTAALASNTPGTVLAVDTWKGSDEQDAIDSDVLRNEFGENTSRYINITTMQTTSLEAAKTCAEEGLTFDFIFIDARHDYNSVKEDILAWSPLLKPNGILAGHDYNPTWYGVIRAVDELIPEKRVVWSIWTTEK